PAHLLFVTDLLSYEQCLSILNIVLNRTNDSEIIVKSKEHLIFHVGRRGHIKESLGTHVHMKCLFDGIFKSQDTIFMNLYKSVHREWTYETILGSTTRK
ncbi:unnamed protein product, partial [Rotaria sp. Silwood1]